MARPTLSDAERARESARRTAIWDKEAPKYDKRIGWCERHLFGQDHRPWACSHAHGDVLEVAVGTGLNLPFYPADLRLTAIDLSPGMLEIARRRAADLGREVTFQEGNAHSLPFEDHRFDTVLCTLSLCNIPDERLALQEMKRVLRPGGRLVLVDHIRSSNRVVFGLQRVIELASVRFEGDHMTRRPLQHVAALGFEIEDTQRSRWGIVERVLAKRSIRSIAAT
ncbi:MAG: class I SAM-dependent methyltransferase [Actinomycetota bacterium]|nr:class I SAM-dependent methyltransferase [Actinomycetota bacterium]